MYKDQYISVIIAAAGMSNRMGSKINKQFIFINNKLWIWPITYRPND